ncbi:hypothetical protein AWR36_008970 [Microbulbifer flavimaris]|uniref:DUF4124 domain-containing protein n=1 Tax=Microbulbifer flavimaris TaxID=1781068 RepID=A0ABX4I2H0_9GAMM|nr:MULTISPECIES: hypothetical protein [Microbulbifer]KUJ83930.1 hypothetical protein AVO43_08935 [Microbulbifer sp. ZGT114]PCO06107.1 hypothetical protein AWR36_008970 [Microbulbifer flavimaris]
MRFAPYILAGCLAVSASNTAISAEQSRALPGKGEVLFRYTNEHGIQVLDDVVPPRYAPGGYEVLSPSGRVLEVVPPQLSGEELKRKRQSEAQREADMELLRRYSSLADIESARSRKLAIVKQDMALLRSNLSSIELQIEQAEAVAARTQRHGDEVAPELLERIANLRQEMKVLHERMEHREQEAARVDKEFDRAAERFTQIAGK